MVAAKQTEELQWKRKKSREISNFIVLKNGRKLLRGGGESGLNKTTYCKREGLTPSAFGRWFERVSSLPSNCEKKAKIKKEVQDAFIPLHLSAGLGGIELLVDSFYAKKTAEGLDFLK